MKKSVLILLVFFSWFSYSQSYNKLINERKHELKVGGFKLIAGPILETTFEYVNSKEFTYGASMLINLKSNNDFNEDFSLTPFVRFYFQESKEYGAKGFFVEGFGKIATGYENNPYSMVYKKYTATALGLSVGKKWINTSGFVFETLFGIGRTLGDTTYAPEVFFRGDLFVGYRF